MSVSEAEERELLLYLAGALPMGRRARLFLRSRLNARLRDGMLRLREEERVFARSIMPDLAERLSARLPRGTDRAAAARPRRAFPAANVTGRFGIALAPKTVFAGIALSVLLAGSIWMAQSAEMAGLERGRACLVMAEGHPPAPMLILGY